ncbi:phage tail tip lysozyme, partial [Enterococcus sp. C62]
ERPNDPLSGHGIAQWTAGRTTNLMNFAKSKGKDWSDLGLQIEFLIHELETTEKAAQAALKASTVEEGTAQWQKLFERAGDPMMGNRLNYANQWYAKLSSNDPIAQVTLSNGATAGQQD